MSEPRLKDLTKITVEHIRTGWLVHVEFGQVSFQEFDTELLKAWAKAEETAGMTPEASQ